MMPPKGRKHCRSLLPDVLSYLPDNISDVILMHLPCKDAVKTSILSKKWRYHWCRLTELKLDEFLWKTKKDLLNPTVKFTKIIYQLLTLHEGPITKFTLNVAHLESCPEIDNFICFLSRNDIQHLVLHLPLGKMYKLPSALFTCSQLRHLNLHNCSIHHPSAFQGFNKLISLELCGVTISSEVLESLISHCPLLEQLVLDIAENSNTVEINAPMLSSFNFSGNISSICLKNVPCLVKASLECDYIKAEDLDFAKVFESCSALEYLLFNLFNSGFFAEEGFEVPTRLPFDLNSVKRFYLPDIVLIEPSYELSYALCLIRSFPYLEYLEIKADCEDEEDDSILECFKLEHFSNVTFNHLREVKLACFVGTTPEMQLIKLLLAKSPVLLRILIDTRYLHDKPLDTRSKIFAELMLDIPKILNIIEIDSPMLRLFDFTGNISYLPKECPSSGKSILAGYDMRGDDIDFAKVFESCSSLEHLLFKFLNIWLFAEEGYEAPTRLPFDLNSVKRFYLPETILVESYDLSFSLCLIISFPYLEYLEIKVHCGDEEDGCILECLELGRFSDVTLNHLREVKLECFGGTTMQLIKLLLAMSPVLASHLSLLLPKVCPLCSSQNLNSEAHKKDKGISDQPRVLVLGDYWYMMPPNERNRCQSLTPDILTDLPNNVIDIILMRLPCEEAVRTSILSKRWRYHWCRLTKLTLDWSLWRTENDLLNPTYKFTEIISQILTLHEGPLTDFTLEVDNLESCPDIGSFIYIVLRNNIQRLVLHLPEDSKLPTSVFTCSQLRYLSLRNCSIHHPSAFEGFDKLISLELCEVTISSELLESIISHCPLLEQLILDIPKLLNTIEIDAPMLSSFDFTGNISSICLKNVPLLVEVSLAGYQIMEKDIDFAKVFNSCSAIEYLSLNIACVWAFAQGEYEAPARLPFDLNCVKRFDLLELALVDAYELSLSISLIRSFPYLEYLEIDVYREDEDSGTKESDELKELRSRGIRCLKKVQREKRQIPSSIIFFLDSHWHCMMPPERRKSGRQRLPIDRLSNLPKNVINSILMRLPLQDAVMTSILSKKWRYKWCRLPQLTLDDDLWEETHDLLSPSIKFTKIMYQILTLHSGPLTKFTLSISALRKYLKINSLIYFLSRNDIQDLVLKFSEWNRYRLPPSFFTCSQLRHLTLKNCVICPPPAFKGFDMLNSLNLCDVTISSKILESLISYSPLLEKLVLKISDTSDHLQINAPNLRSFDFTGCIKYISLRSVPLLSKLSLPRQKSIEESEKCDFDKFFQLLSALEHLYLANGSDQFLVTGAAEVPRRLSSPLNYLKRFNITLWRLADFSIALCLIRSSPYIQDIEMEVYCSRDYLSEKLEASNEVDEVLASFSDVTLNHLRTVQLEGVGGIKLELQLIKLLLTKSPMLVKMLIDPSSGDNYDARRDKILAATTVQRASSKANVVVSDKYEYYRDTTP
ncbi:hypothetical protein KY289_007268 [Solanum tuberosum]|nr:hypothetical protein KY289_007268 [Solanum tuberosum]